MCVCVLSDRVVGSKMALPGYGRIEGCDVSRSRNQHNVGWYNVADTGSFARVCVSAVLLNFSTAGLCSSYFSLSKSVFAVVSHLVKTSILYFSGFVSSRDLPALSSTNSETSQVLYGVLTPFADHAVIIAFLHCSSVTHTHTHTHTRTRAHTHASTHRHARTHALTHTHL